MMKLFSGGRSRRRSTRKHTGGRKKSNGHKATCQCPICKNMKKSGRTRRRRG